MAQIPQPAATEADDPSDPPSQGAYLLKADIVWMTLLAVVVAVNFWFGFHNHGEAHRVAIIKTNAEDLLKWLDEKSETREQGGQSSQAAIAQRTPGTAVWPPSSPLADLLRHSAII